MDYTQTAYFTGAQPYEQFIGIQPITPAHSNSVASDDYNTTSPPVGRPLLALFPFFFEERDRKPSMLVVGRGCR